MNETVLPDVTTSLFVRAESSIEVIGLGKLRLVVSVRVRRSHHLSAVLSVENARIRGARCGGSYLICPSSPADTPVCSPTHTTLLIVPS